MVFLSSYVSSSYSFFISHSQSSILHSLDPLTFQLPLVVPVDASQLPSTDDSLSSWS